MAGGVQKLHRLLNIDTFRTHYRNQRAAGALERTRLALLLVDHNLRAMLGEAWGGGEQERHGTWGRLSTRRQALLEAR
jgi:hypothetical protein